MPTNTRFIGVSFAVINDHVCGVAASDGQSLFSMDGLASAEVLAFIWQLQTKRIKGERTILVAFDFAVDLEILFQDLTGRQKDVFYHILAQKEDSLGDNPLREKPEKEINHGGFKVSCLPGKILRLAIPKRAGLVLYDVRSYFEGCDLNKAIEQYLPGTSGIGKIEKNLLPLWKEGLSGEIVERSVAEASAVARLAEKVRDTIGGLSLNPRAWYGPSAIAGHCLNKWGARKEARRLREGNSPGELLKAIDVAYVGGRVEVVKLGTIDDVRTFDLNSAYAYATTLLSQFYNPLRFTRQYDPACPFACWQVDYELPEDTALGALPARAARGGIMFALRGRGYFWQPEVDYLRQRYPDSFRVRWGYVTPEYKPVTFAASIQEMYDYRMHLKAQGDKGEKIIKLALSNLYGKFAQNKGAAFYQCRAWAGWITSLVRRLMLEAITGIEDRVICFCQDAIHVAGKEARVSIGEGLGQWKRQEFAQGLYVAPGIYELREKSAGPGNDKQASRGSNLGLDFAKLAGDLSKRQVTELSRQFFVGWQMARQNPVKYQDSYLAEVTESLSIVPSNMKARNYRTEFNWNKESRDSTISNRFSGLMSAPYRPAPYRPAGNQSSGALRMRLKDPGWM